MGGAVHLVLVPVDAGVVGERMGRGPDALMDAGLASRVGSVESVRLLPGEGWRAELRTTFELHERIAAETRLAVTRGRAPFVVAGDCSATVGVVAGLGAEARTGMVWLDAHGDFNTPDTDPSGYLDGQGLAMLTGRCWRAHTRSLTGFVPVPDHRVLLVGSRDLDDEERAELERSGIRRLDPAHVDDPAAVRNAFTELSRDVDRLHLHVDADVLDPSVGRANDWAAPGGLLVDQVRTIVAAAAHTRPVASVTLASWDPDADPSERMRDALLDVADALARALRN